MSIINDLADLGEESNYKSNKPNHPRGYEPGVEWDGSKGYVVTEPLSEAPKDWTAILGVWGLPTDGSVKIVEPIQMRAWDTQTKDGIQRMFYYRANVISAKKTWEAKELLDVIDTWKPFKKNDFKGDTAFIVNYADTQIGKMDGDGSQGTIDRVLAKTDAAVERLKELRKTGHEIDEIYLPQLGDCIEGFNSGGGNRSWRNDLDLTQQIRVYRRLLLHVVKTFAPLADKIVVPCVPGNHDEAVRQGNQMATSSTDSFALDAASAVADAVKLWGADHISFVFPKTDTLTITLNIKGTIVGFTHGHQTRGKAPEWWSKQAHGMQPIGDATLLLTGHFHHLHIQQTGPKTWIQMPALDGGSQWFVDRTGLEAPAGLVTFTINPSGWKNLSIV